MMPKNRKKMLIAFLFVGLVLTTTAAAAGVAIYAAAQLEDGPDDESSLKAKDPSGVKFTAQVHLRYTSHRASGSIVAQVVTSEVRFDAELRDGLSPYESQRELDVRIDNSKTCGYAFCTTHDQLWTITYPDGVVSPPSTVFAKVRPGEDDVATTTLRFHQYGYGDYEIHGDVLQGVVRVCTSSWSGMCYTSEKVEYDYVVKFRNTNRF